MDRTVRLPALCTQSIHTVAVPDVDIKLKLPDSILINHPNQKIYIYVHTHTKTNIYTYTRINEICLPQVCVLQKTFV